MSLWKEIGELRRYRKLPQTSREVIFYAEHSGYFAYFEGVVQELTIQRGRDVCYITSDPADPILKDHPERLHPIFLRTLLPYFMIAVKCRVFVMTLTDLHHFHLKRSSHPVHYVYMFHSMVSTHMMYRAGAFDHYDSILCVGPHHIREFEAGLFKDRPDIRLVESGYYRLERIYQAYHRKTASDTGGDRRTVLVAPSWGEQNILNTCGSEVIEKLLSTGARVVVRPHPETVRRRPNLIKDLRRQFQSNANFELELSVAGDESLLAADLLVCDLSGVAIEYALGTERPVLFIDLPPKVKNPDYQGLGHEPVELARRPELGQLMAPDDLDRLPDVVSDLIERSDRYAARLRDIRKELVFHFGQSAQRAADHIESLLPLDRRDRSGSGGER